MKEGQYYYKPHHRMWAVWQNHNIGNSSSVGTLIKDNLTRDEAREEVYRLNGWCNQKKIKNEMKQKFKKENSPRLKNAIKRAFAYSGQWMYFPTNMLGELILYYAYGADKYDVLNALCPGIRGKVITFIRGDIRHKKKRTCFGGIAREITLPLIVILVMLLSNDW